MANTLKRKINEKMGIETTVQTPINTDSIDGKVQKPSLLKSLYIPLKAVAAIGMALYTFFGFGAGAGHAEWVPTQTNNGDVKWTYQQKGTPYGTTTEGKTKHFQDPLVKDLAGNVTGHTLQTGRHGNGTAPDKPKPLDYHTLKQEAYACQNERDYKCAVNKWTSICPNFQRFLQREEYNAAIEALIHAMKMKGIKRNEQAEDLWHFGRVYTSVNKGMGKTMLKYVRDNYTDTPWSEKASETINVHNLN